MKSKDCIALWGVEYQTYLLALLVSLIIGFALTALVLAVRKQPVWSGKLVKVGIIVSVIIFIVLSILLIYWQSTAIY